VPRTLIWIKMKGSACVWHNLQRGHVSKGVAKLRSSVRQPPRPGSRERHADEAERLAANPRGLLTRLCAWLPFDCHRRLPTHRSIAILSWPFSTMMALMLLHSPVAASPADGLTLKQKTRSTCARRIGGNGPQNPRSCAVMLGGVLRRRRLTSSSQLQ
jgi:hypothetical protein